MTSKRSHKKGIEYNNHAENNESKSLMTPEQKSEIDKRSAKFKQGKLKASSWEDVKYRSRNA